MEINTLVTHKKFKWLGIGCISKVFKNQYQVNFGTSDTSKVKKDLLVEVDTSKCKTIKFHELKRMVAANDKKLNYVIVGNELKCYVGVGLVSEGVITLNDLKKYPRVVD